MHAINYTRKAAFSFLSNISLQDPNNSTNDENREESSHLNIQRTGISVTVESSDPQLEIPPDPDLELSNRIRSRNLVASSINHSHKPLKSKRDRVATKFLSNIVLSSPSVPEGKDLATSPSDSLIITSELMGCLSLPRRASTVPVCPRRKSQIGFLMEGNDTSSSSSESSSEDEQLFYKGTGSYTDEDVQLSNSRKSSYLIDLTASRELAATQAMSVSPVFAKKPNRRSKTGKSSKKTGTKRNTDSYAHLLSPKKTLVPMPPSEYNPLFLDDPSIQLEIKTSGLYSIMDSLMQFTKTSESTIDPEDSFLAEHPSVDISLSLSLIRSIKAKMIAVAQHLDLELASVAHAFAYFEKLCLQGLVNKDSRRTKAAACLFLATKVNEHKRKLEGFMDAVDKFLDVSEKELRTIEFATFAELEFNLFLPKSEFLPHLERILKDFGYSDIENYVEKRTFYLHYPEETKM